jgi:hypothetical protein
MKKGFFALLLCLAAIGITPALGRAESEGRYQLLEARYPHYDGDQGTMGENHDLFLLDTVTGDVQVYSSSTQKGKQIRYWMPAVFDETQQP